MNDVELKSKVKDLIVRRLKLERGGAVHHRMGVDASNRRDVVRYGIS